MAVPSTLADLSTTAANNSPAGSDAIGTSLDDYLRAIQAIVKAEASSQSDIASASTITPAASGKNFHVTGTTTITAIGSTNSWNGREIAITFDGALTLTHNATSLILPSGASITTAAGDCAVFKQESSGNWRCLGYQRASGAALVDTTTAATQAEMEAASSNAVMATPGNLKWGPMIPKAWGYITNSGSATLVSSYGVTSINRTGVGAITVTLSTAFSSSNYAIITSSVGIGHTAGATISSSSVFALSTRNGANADADVNVYFVCFGDQ